MPRASWRGHLRLSLVSCPIYLSPATARTKPIRLHQVWQASPAGEVGEPTTQHREREGEGLLTVQQEWNTRDTLTRARRVRLARPRGQGEARLTGNFRATGKITGISLLHL
jgi:hypothetical protein